MTRNVLLLAIILILGAQFIPARADPPLTVFEKALYEKARYRVVSRLNDEDFASYCVTMNVGGDTLLKFHDEILAKQTELAAFQSAGLAEDNPKVTTANNELRDLRAQYSVKITEARKGLEIESRIAEETLSDLTPYQK